ncbi:hypothetical protein BH23GEM10_BH23GEM10_12540 [soil metagenome]
MQLSHTGSRTGTRASGFGPARRVPVAVLLALLAASCGSAGTSDNRNDEMSRTIEEVLAARTPELMRMTGVEGTGIGLCDDKPCIRVYVRNEEVAGTVPKTLEGHTVSTVVTGMIRPRTGD